MGVESSGVVRDAAGETIADVLARQRRKQHTRLLVVLLAVPLLLLVLVFALALTRGIGIKVTPDEAISAAEIVLHEGLGVVIGQDVYALADEVVIQVSSPGFRTETVVVAPQQASSYKEVSLVAKPGTFKAGLLDARDGSAIQGAGKATVADWYLNGNWQNSGPTLEVELEAGAYSVVIEHPYYQMHQHSFELERGEVLSRDFSLLPVQGHLQITSTPPGAEILINGSARGSADLAMDLDGGEYEVSIRLPNHAVIEETLEITRDKPSLIRNYKLLKHPAYVNLKISPEGGTLLLNGTQLDAQDQTLQLAARTPHTVVYERPGYHSVSQQLNLAPGEKAQVELALREHLGRIAVRSEPPAEVEIDGRVLGTTPLSLNRPAVEQTLTLRRDGYHTVSQTVTPHEQAEQLVSVRLVTELEHRLANLPRHYVNPVGMQMRQFRPDEFFTMGAPRSEKGQRANEILRQVELSKAFYVSTTEVTNAQFAAFASKNTGAPGFPQTAVSWNEAAQFANWLSLQEGLTPIYQFRGSRLIGAEVEADGYRLPTEAEWEWLARKAGRRAVSNFVWGNEYTVPAGAGNFADESSKAQTQIFIPRFNDGYAGVAPVASFAADDNGLYDMAGNVREWVHDVYDIDPTGRSTRNPVGPSIGASRVIKGSSWRSGSASELRSSYRDTAVAPADDLGFRLVRYVYGAESS